MATTALRHRLAVVVAIAGLLLVSGWTGVPAANGAGGERLAPATIRTTAKCVPTSRTKCPAPKPAPKATTTTARPAPKPAPKPAKPAPKPKTQAKATTTTARPVAKPTAPPPTLAASRPSLGDGSRYTFMALDEGIPVRWDPCQPVHYVVNPSFAPPSGLADLERALQLVSEATGLQFQNDGLTTDFPTAANLKTRAHSADRWPPVLIAWVTPDVSDLVEPGGAGMGGAAWAGFPGEMAFITGQVAIDATAARRLLPGLGPNGSHGALVLHELGHLVGLGHAGDPNQLMYPTIGGAVASFGPGDRAGLELLSAKQGCKPPPPPF